MIVEQYFEGYAIGSERTSFGRTITETDFVVHAGHTGDFFPHHMDAAWCATQDFGQRIAHGTLVFSVGIGLTATTINPHAMSYGYDRLRFIRPVHIGDTITTVTRITGKRDHPKRATHGIVTEAVDIRNQRGETVLACEHSYAHPSSTLADTRTTMMLDYGRTLRATLSINHHHDFGRRFQDGSFRVEGTEGAAMVKLGLLLDYPAGEPDELWLAPRGGPWAQVTLEGAWFPDAFIGPMANLQRSAAGEDDRLATNVEDAWKTMALVEAAYASNRAPMTPIPSA